MSTKLLNVELSLEEYIPVKPLIDRLFSGNWDKHPSTVRYIAAVANLHGTYISNEVATMASIVYIKVELRRRRNSQISTTVMITLAIPSEEKDDENAIHG